MDKTQMIIGAVIILVIILGGVMFAKNQQSTKMKAAEEKAMMAKKQEAEKMRKDEKSEETMTMQAMKMAMEDKTSQKVALSDVSGGTSVGTAYLLRKDGKLYHTVTANLPDPTDGQFYEGWLVKNPAAREFFSTGVMTKDKEGMHTLTYTSDNLYEGYNTVIITLEKTKDAIPEKHILEGTIK